MPIDLDDEPAFAVGIGLRHVSVDEPGIRREVRGRGFSYRSHDGELLRGDQRARCEALVLPPAWRDVWICADPIGHLQGAGTDDAGRRQYRYHERWTDARRRANFDRLPDVGEAIGELRPRLQRLLDDDDPVRRALAAMLALVDRSLGRIGNESSVAEAGTYGISTLHDDHVEVAGAKIRLSFVGKGGVAHETEVVDRDLAAVLEELAEDGERLFSVVDGGRASSLTARDANEFLAEITRGRLHCKDFRTWGASAVALEARVGGAGVLASVDAAADVLQNTRAVARSAYVHPGVLEAADDELAVAWRRSRTSSRHQRRERALLNFLDGRPPLVAPLLAA